MLEALRDLCASFFSFSVFASKKQSAPLFPPLPPTLHPGAIPAFAPGGYLSP